MDRSHQHPDRRQWRSRAASLLAVLVLAGAALPAGAQQSRQVAGGDPIPAQMQVLPGGVASAERPEFADLWAALRLSDLIGIMVREGLAYGADLGEEMFPSRTGPGWDETVARIYDPAGMERDFRKALAEALNDSDLAPMIGFFDTAQGRLIVGLEISAREALLDDAIEESSRDLAKSLKAQNPSLFAALTDFVAANDLVEMNVAGAMNANLAFFTGLMDAGSGPMEMSEGEILADVWAQEADIREQTETWVYSYLALAYRPLPEGMLAEYTRFSRSEAGRALNSALFAAFDMLFVGISHDLGMAAAAQMVGEDL